MGEVIEFKPQHAPASLSRAARDLTSELVADIKQPGAVLTLVLGNDGEYILGSVSNWDIEADELYSAAIAILQAERNGEKVETN